jgi:hypothetical protein
VTTGSAAADAVRVSRTTCALVVSLVLGIGLNVETLGAPWELRIDIPGATSQTVSGISSNGQNVVGSYTTQQGFFWFLWRSGQFTTLPFTQAFISNVNARGDVIGVAFFPETQTSRAFLHRTDGTTTPISCPTPTRISPLAINNAGTVVGWWENLDETISGFRWRNGRCELLPIDRFVLPADISESGIIVGTASTRGGIDEFEPSYGFILKGDEIVTVEHPEAAFSNGGVTALTDVAPNGLVLGWSSPSVPRMLQGDLRWFVYRDGVFQPIAIPRIPREFEPLSISASGVITYRDTDNVIRAFRVPSAPAHF